MRDLEALKRTVPAYKIIAKYLNDGLRQEGVEYVACCPFHEEKSPSFKVYEKSGQWWWKCFGCGEHGDIIAFIQKFEKLADPNEAMARLEELVGKATDYKATREKVESNFQDVGKTTEKARTSFNVARWAEQELALSKNEVAQSWLLRERGIDYATAKKMRFGYQQEVTGRLDAKEEGARKGGWIAFPRIIKDKVVAVKFRSIAAKAFTQTANMLQPSALYNSETITPFEPVFVTEGEFDAAIFELCDFRAVSVPAAGVALPPDQKELLKQAEVVYLAGDNDNKVGTLYMKSLQTQLGGLTYLLIWPGAKDANEFFIKICKSDKEKFRQYVFTMIEKAKSTPVVGFTSLTERLRATGNINAAKDPRRVRHHLKAIDDMNYTPAGGHIVVYSTYTGTGKTVFTTEWVTGEALRGEPVVVFSPELRDQQYLALIVSQVLGPQLPGGLPRGGEITEQQKKETAKVLLKTTNGEPFQFYVGHSIPSGSFKEVIDFVEQVISITGCTRFVVDTFHRIVDSITAGRESHTELEGKVANALDALGIKYGCSFFFIGQSNKEAEELKEERHDSEGVLRGTRVLSDIAYGIYLLHRKRIKSSDPDAADILEPVGRLVLKKDRGKGPGKPVVPVIYHKPTSRFLIYTEQQPPPGTRMTKATGGQAPLTTEPY